MNWLDDFTAKNSIWHFEFQSEENVENLKRFIYTILPPPSIYLHTSEFFFCVCKALGINRQEQDVKKISQYLVIVCRGFFWKWMGRIAPFGIVVKVKSFYANHVTLSVSSYMRSIDQTILNLPPVKNRYVKNCWINRPINLHQVILSVLLSLCLTRRLLTGTVR